MPDPPRLLLQGASRPLVLCADRSRPNLLTCSGVVVFFLGLVAAAGPSARPSPDRHTTLSGYSAKDGATKRVYVGMKRCRMCHTKQYESFQESAKANAWDALRPGYGTQVKRKAGLDPRTDYTEDPQCLRCHALGFGEEGGYVVPDPTDADAQRMAAARQGVACESCHGPGSEYVKVMRSILIDDRKYRPEEVRAAGRRIVTAQICRSCHNDEARCMTSAEGEDLGLRQASDTQIDAMDRTGYHERFELTHRAKDDGQGRLQATAESKEGETEALADEHE